MMNLLFATHKKELKPSSSAYTFLQRQWRKAAGFEIDGFSLFWYGGIILRAGILPERRRGGECSLCGCLQVQGICFAASTGGRRPGVCSVRQGQGDSERPEPVYSGVGTRLFREARMAGAGERSPSKLAKNVQNFLHKYCKRGICMVK